MNKDSDIDRAQLDIDRLTGPAFTFTHPDEVLHSSLSVVEKRGVLAAWASDVHAVPNLPAMRQLDSGAIVHLDTVLAALRTLDGVRVAAISDGRSRTSPKRVTRSLDPRWFRPWGRRHRDDDDDPPPCPATALPPGVELELRRQRDAARRLVAA